MQTNIEKIDVEFEEYFPFKRQVIYNLEKIYNENYIYSVDNLVDMLKIQRVYIQENVCSKLDNFELDTHFKLYVKSVLGSKKDYSRLSREYGYNQTHTTFMALNRDVAELARRAKMDNHKLTRRILVSKEQLKKSLLDLFSVEIYAEDEDIVVGYLPITENDANMILEYGLEDPAHLKEYYSVKTELQVYRRLKKNDGYVLRKYVIPVAHEKKKGLTRYLVNKEETLDSLNEIRNCLYTE